MQVILWHENGDGGGNVEGWVLVSRRKGQSRELCKAGSGKSYLHVSQFGLVHTSEQQPACHLVLVELVEGV